MTDLPNYMQLNFLERYGPWAVITGASDGIGRALTIEFAAQGLSVFAVARTEAKLKVLSQQIGQSYPVAIRTLALDLGANGATQVLVDATSDLNIGLFAAIAGFGTFGPFLDSSLQTELNMLDVNCRAVVEQCYHFGKIFAAQGRGGIILMGSLVGFQGVPNAALYAATKAFIQTFAEGLYLELEKQGVDVLASAPGPVQSGFGERARMNMQGAASPHKVARGTMKALGRGMTIRPGALSKFLGWSLSTLPRGARVHVMKQVMGEMTRHQARATWITSQH